MKVIAVDDNADAVDQLVNFAVDWLVDSEDDCERAHDVQSGIKAIEDNWGNVGYIFIDLDFGSTYKHPHQLPNESIDLALTAGFRVYFRVNQLLRSDPPPLTPLVILCTAHTKDAKEWLHQFMPGIIDDETVTGRPFIILDKAGTTDKSTVWPPLLMKYEWDRMLLMESLGWDLQMATVVLGELGNALDDIGQRSDLNVLERLRVVIHRDGESLYLLSDLLPVWCRSIDLLDQQPTYTINDKTSKELLQELLQKLGTLDHLRSLNRIFSRRLTGSGWCITHNHLENGKWAQFTEHIKCLPNNTACRLNAALKDPANIQCQLSQPDRSVPPWGDVSAYSSWLERVDRPFKNRWREWKLGAESTCAELIASQVESSLGFSQKCDRFNIINHVMTSKEDNKKYRDPVECYADADAIATVLAGYASSEIKLRAWQQQNKTLWFRVVHEPNEDVCFDLANDGESFGDSLAAKASNPRSSLSQLATDLRGWCDVEVFSRKKDGSIASVSLSLGTQPPGSEWPDERGTDEQNRSIPFAQVASLYRLKFRSSRFRSS